MLGPKNKVFMIGWEYPPHNSGGLGVACQELTEALAQQNTQIYFSLPYVAGGSISHMKILDCRHPDWDSSQNQPPFFAYDGSITATGKVVISKLNADELSSLPTSDLEQQVTQYSDVVGHAGVSYKDDYDVVHAHDWFTYPAGLQLKKKTGKPMVAHVHSTEYDRSPGGIGNKFITQIEKLGLEGADKVIAVSNYTRQILIRHYGIPASKIDVVYNGFPTSSKVVRLDEPQFAHKRPVVVFMGRLTGQKGPEYFLKLARNILNQVPDALFIVAGSGDLYHELILKTAVEGMSANLVFSGFVRDKQRDKLLDRADVFVMPSISEPFGLVAMEAAQRHTPVIVSKNSGVREVLKGAISVDFWDIELMTATIAKILDDPAHKEDIINTQINSLKDASWQSSAKKVNTIYREVFQGL